MEPSANIARYFFESAARYPDRIAIADEKSSITYRSLEKKILETAAYFQSEGLQKGDRVLVFVPISIDLYRIVLALFHSGAIVVFLDEWVSIKRLEACCRLADCKAFIGGWKVHALALFSKELRKIPVKLSLKYSQSSVKTNVDNVLPDDTALLTFTTGSTGAPKAAKRTHAFLEAQFQALQAVIQPQPGDVDMTNLPIVLLINLGMGSTSVLPGFKSKKEGRGQAKNILKLMSEHGVNRLTGSPYFIQCLAEETLEQKTDTALISKIFTGGGPVFPVDAALYQEAFSKADITIVYGSTEAEPISTISAEKLLQMDSEFLPAGYPDPGISVQVIHIYDEPIGTISSSQFEDICLKQGEVGEIIVAGNHVLKEYFNSDEAYKRNKIIVDGTIWHRTGDAGRINSDGVLELAGRCTEIIEKDGRRIYPFLTENKLRGINGIKLAALLENGNELLCVVETIPNADKTSISNQVTDMLPGVRVVFVKAIPRDPRHFSKTDYTALRKLLRINAKNP